MAGVESVAIAADITGYWLLSNGNEATRWALILSANDVIDSS